MGSVENWRLQSQRRGAKLLAFAVPVLILAFISGSQVSRAGGETIFDLQSERRIIKQSFSLRQPDLMIQLSFDTTPKLEDATVLRYKIRDEGKTIRSRSVKLKPRDSLDNIPIETPFRLSQFSDLSIIIGFSEAQTEATNPKLAAHDARNYALQTPYAYLSLSRVSCDTGSLLHRFGPNDGGDSQVCFIAIGKPANVAFNLFDRY